MALPRFLVVEARFYEEISDHLFNGAATVLMNAGVGFERIAVPGALEIPAVIGIANQGANPKFDGFVALGCVIRGETSHYETVCSESARGLQVLAVSFGLAIGNGILTCETWEQAMVRARPDDQNKGGGAVEACLAVFEARRRFGLVTP
ncbi:MAG: 6,7-dimethyl-8-ribityllumazine synthase [Alphaproteobacteria bacterium]|nr:6,7-dimethyl-8-ribityllumazine synthase [Alphaproteobacteria bacterium]